MKHIDAKGSVHDFLATLKTEFGHDRSYTVGASEIGKCARMIGYKKSGAEPDDGDEFQKRMDGFGARGNLMEDGFSAPFLRWMVEKMGGSLHFAGQENQTTLENRKKASSATADGVAVNVPATALKKFGVPKISGSFLGEFKSFDPRKNTRNYPEYPHKAQVNFGLGQVRGVWKTLAEIIGDETGKKAAKPNAGYLLYVNASDYADLHEFAFPFDEKVFKNQEKRARMIMDAVENGKVELLRPEGKITGECRNCEFAGQCSGYAAMVPRETQELDDKAKAEIAEKARQWAEAKAQAEAADQVKKGLEGEIRELLVAKKTRWADTGVAKVNWNTTKGRESFNRKKAEAALVAAKYKIADFITTGNPGEQLKIEYLGTA